MCVAESSSTQPSSTDVADGGRNDPEQAAKFSSEIRTFIESGEAELAFPPELSAAERKVVHDICYELDLTCKSRGPKKAGGRFITVYKPEAAQSAKLKAQRDAHTLGRSPHAQLPRSSTPGPMLFCWSIAAPCRINASITLSWP